MWRIVTATFMAIGLALGGTRAGEAGSPSALDSLPDLVTPYQPYNLRLSPFYPRPNRAGGVILRVRLNGGRPLRLLLDSGADLIVISAKAGRSLGLSAGSETDLVGLGTRPAKMGRAGTVEIGPVSFRNCPVALVGGKVAEGADGVIPLSLFSDFLLRLDLPEKTLGLIPYPRAQSPAIPPTRSITKHRLLIVETVLNGKKNGYVVLDTAAYCSGISREVARSLSGSRIAPEVRLAAGTGAATGERVPSTVHFAIAAQDLVPNEVVAMDLSNLSRHYGVEIIGVLGFPELTHYVLTIDYGNGQVRMEPPQNISVRSLQGGQNTNLPAPLAFH
jgi:hypothetical protein